MKDGPSLKLLVDNYWHNDMMDSPDVTPGVDWLAGVELPARSESGSSLDLGLDEELLQTLQSAKHAQCAQGARMEEGALSGSLADGAQVNFLLHGAADEPAYPKPIHFLAIVTRFYIQLRTIVVRRAVNTDVYHAGHACAQVGAADMQRLGNPTISICSQKTLNSYLEVIYNCRSCPRAICQPGPCMEWCRYRQRHLQV